MENLNLKKLWEVCNTLSNKQSELCEQSIFVHLMGHRSNYEEMCFENFLEYYSFKVITDEILVFNNEPISWEEYTTDDFSYIPLSLLSFADWQLENWMQNEIDLQLAQQKREKEQRKEDLKEQIKYLKKQLNNL